MPPSREVKSYPGHPERVMASGGPRPGGEGVYPHSEFEGEGGFEDVGQVPDQTLPIPASSSLQQLLERFKGSSNWLKLGLIGLAVVGLYIGLDESRKRKFFS